MDKTTTNNLSSYKSSSDLDETESLHSTKKSVVSEALFRPTKVCFIIPLSPCAGIGLLYTLMLIFVLAILPELLDIS